MSACVMAKCLVEAKSQQSHFILLREATSVSAVILLIADVIISAQTPVHREINGYLRQQTAPNHSLHRG